MEIEFRKDISDEERAQVVRSLSDLNFNIIARSRFGLSVISDIETIERAFRSKINSEDVLVRGGPSGKITLKRLFFAKPPQVPENIRAFVKTVRFPPPIIPLLKGEWN